MSEGGGRWGKYLVIGSGAGALLVATRYSFTERGFVPSKVIKQNAAPPPSKNDGGGRDGGNGDGGSGDSGGTSGESSNDTLEMVTNAAPWIAALLLVVVVGVVISHQGRGGRAQTT